MLFSIALLLRGQYQNTRVSSMSNRASDWFSQAVRDL